ncbi:MAG: hypothetical protein Q9191_006420 [Dirinaria sp. TL-2023a]
MAPIHNRLVPTWIIFWFFLLLLSSTAIADCFNPNGTNRNIGAPDVPSGTEVYFPCNTVQPYSMCCRDTDKCLANGLCQQGGSTNLWRESCTDQSWRSAACVKLCVSETAQIWKERRKKANSYATQSGTDQPVKKCPDESYCCNGDNTNATQCCEQGNGLWIVDGQVTNKNPNATTSSTTTSSSSSAHPTVTILNSPAEQNTTSAAAPSSQNNSSGGGESNAGAIAGGVVGGVVALGIIIGGVLLLLRRRRRRRRSSEAQTPPMEVFYPPQVGMGMDTGKRLQEVEGTGADDRRELDGKTRSEMDAGGVKR